MANMKWYDGYHNGEWFIIPFDWWEDIVNKDVEEKLKRSGKERMLRPWEWHELAYQRYLGISEEDRARNLLERIFNG